MNYLQSILLLICFSSLAYFFENRVELYETIVIDQPGIYDFNNTLHVWAGLGECNQLENQPYLLRIASSDVTIKNFAYKNAPDGIHIGTSSNG